MRSSSSLLVAFMFVRRGRYWRGAGGGWCSRWCRTATGCGVAEVDRGVDECAEEGVVGHLAAAVPGQDLHMPGGTLNRARATAMLTSLALIPSGSGTIFR